MVTSDLPAAALVKSLINPVTIVCALFACTLAYDEPFAGQYMVLGILVFLISTQVFDDVDVFRQIRGAHATREGRKLVLDWIIVIGILLFLAFATKLSAQFSRKVVLTWFVVTPFALLLAHMVARFAVRRLAVHRNGLRSMVIVGANALGCKLAQRVLEDPYCADGVGGFFDDRNPARLGGAAGPLLGGLQDLPAWVREHGVGTIYITLPMVAQPRIMKVLDELGDTTASVYFVPDIFAFDLIQARFDELEGIPVVAICESPFAGFNSVLKRLCDIVFGGAALLVLWPVMLAIAAGIKWTSPGPVLFKQRRYGLDGAQIMVYKFRSMKVLEDGAVVRQATRNDDRITPLGAFLRRTSLDELPQLLNVLQGTMSIVGPRPHAVAHNEQYRKLIKRYMVRHKVKPGITGWAQVNGFRGETATVEKMESRVAYDLDYMRNWSVALDFWIMLRTVTVVFRDRNAY
ncbi:MAG TPA: undecaprenyl-phosphate glucose phosphotransferase [Burkholderiales bacterium]|nr:undecaprenyl-phosphate glucose phosphotransferase [Burkholderiales bacterium]